MRKKKKTTRELDADKRVECAILVRLTEEDLAGIERIRTYQGENYRAVVVRNLVRDAIALHDAVSRKK